MSKTASGLVAYCKAQLGLPYWWGTFGNIATASLLAYKRKQYPSYYTASDFESQLGKRVHDCVGLIKGYRWSDTPTSEPRYVASQDVAVGGLYSQCSSKGAIRTMPEQPGVCVFMAGMTHVGVYIGDGYVIEARGHAYGVVRTKLSERGWSYWGKPSWIEYDTATGGTTETQEDKTVKVTAKEMQNGSKGSAVKKLQILLNGIGYPCGTVDGEFGAKTETAVKSFQTHHGLTQDGIVGAKTWAQLIG